MIYYKICPYCQELCDQIMKDEIGLMGACSSHNHPLDYKYSFGTISSQNVANIDLFIQDYHLFIKFDPSIKNPTIYSKIRNSLTNKVVNLQSLPFLDWQTFNYEKLSEKLDKIFDMQTFA